MYCDVCGTKIDEIYLAEIEGARIEVCELCARSGRIIKKIEEPVKPRKTSEEEEIEVSHEIVPNYAAIIRRIHQESGLKHQDFAKKINEKESVVKKIESGQIEPSLKLAQKLERMFNIKLIETREVKPEKRTTKQYDESAGVTFGDIVKFKK